MCENKNVTPAQWEQQIQERFQALTEQLPAVVFKNTQEERECTHLWNEVFPGNYEQNYIHVHNDSNVSKQVKKPRRKKSNKWPNKSFSEFKSPSSLILYAKKCHCDKCIKDLLEPKKAIVGLKAGGVGVISIHHCKGCDRYFIEKASFEKYQKRYGKIDVKIIYDNSYYYHSDASGIEYGNSILARLGYSNNKNIPTTTRQKILMEILDNGLAEKWEILECLNSLIRTFKTRSNHSIYEDTIRRYEDDILFVNEYMTDEIENVGMLKVVQGGTITLRNDDLYY